LKKKLTAIVFLAAALSVYGQSRSGASLDDVIGNAALQIQDRLEQGTNIIVYQFQSPGLRLSDYILKELFDKLVNCHKFTVLDRTAQEVINAELDFQFITSAGMISDDSLASLTRRIGAGAIVTGSMEEAGGEYRFRIRVIGTETTAVLASYVGSVNKNDRKTKGLLRNPTTGQKIGTGALNILLGLGSYIEGDISGGLTCTAGYAAAAGLFAIEITMLDWDSPMVGVPATAGLAVAGLTLVYGFARPFIFNRSKRVAVILDNTHAGIFLASDAYTGISNPGFQIAYTIKL